MKNRLWQCDLMTRILTFSSRPSELQQKSNLSHFETGDLGLVPRKTHTTSSKMRNLSRSAYASPHNK